MRPTRNRPATVDNEQLTDAEVRSQYVMHRNNVRFLAKMLLDFMNTPCAVFAKELLASEVKHYGWEDLKLIHKTFSKLAT